MSSQQIETSKEEHKERKLSHSRGRKNQLFDSADWSLGKETGLNPIYILPSDLELPKSDSIISGLSDQGEEDEEKST